MTVVVYVMDLHLDLDLKSVLLSIIFVEISSESDELFARAAGGSTVHATFTTSPLSKPSRLMNAERI